MSITSKEEAQQYVRVEPPAHFSFKIKFFSALSKLAVEGTIKSMDFIVGEHSWNLILHPNGDEDNDHISLYLEMANTSNLPLDWEVNVIYRFFLLDQISDKYLTISHVQGKVSRFHELKRKHGFSQLMPLATFKDSANGYLVDDSCEFGVEVFTIDATSVIECLSLTPNATASRHEWKIEKFSKLKEECIMSEEFMAGNYKWQVGLYSKGSGREKNKSLSLYVFLASRSLYPSGRPNMSLRFCLRNPKNGNHFQCSTTNFWCEKEDKGFGFESFIELAELKKDYLVKDTLTVETEVTVHGYRKEFLNTQTELNQRLPCQRNTETDRKTSIMPKEEIEQFVRGKPPAHFSFKIISFSMLSKLGLKEYKFFDFIAGGYKWNLLLHPNGSKDSDHISLYLAIANTSNLPDVWEVKVIYRFFLLDQIRDEYLTIGDVQGRVRRFHELKTKHGFSQLMPLETFKDSANGYLVDDSCEIGVEVFTIDATSAIECLSLMPNATASRHEWQIKNSSTLTEERKWSEEFKAGEYQWQTCLYPKGYRHENDRSLSLFVRSFSFSTPAGSK